MSTILDALRKIEEENRTRNADARTRLLATPQRFDLRPPRRQRVSWLVSAGLIVGGITVGAGLMGWGWYVRSPSLPVVTTVHVPAPPVPPTPAPAPAATLAPPERINPVAPSVELSPPAVTTQEPTVIVVSPSPAPVATAALADVASTSVDVANPVQRSPFVNTADSEQIASPPSLVEPRIAAKPKPVRKPVPIPRAPVTQESATSPTVEEAMPTPLEEDDVTALTPSAPVEEGEGENGAETSRPPTPASVSFLQWSPEPEKRMAFIKVGDKPTTLAHEGDVVNGVTVVKIRKGAVELRSGESRWTLKAR
jgi:hypothetical protein